MRWFAGLAGDVILDSIRWIADRINDPKRDLLPPQGLGPLGPSRTELYCVFTKHI